MKFRFKLLLIMMIFVAMFSFVGCGAATPGEKGEDIIDAKEALELLSKDNVVLVDGQKSDIYLKAHVKNAVNISRSDIVINEPFSNMLAPKEQIEEVIGKNGISNDTLVVIYDKNKNMDSGRLWWTLKVYGHENIKVVSGGLDALIEAGAEITTDTPNVTPVKYTAKDKNIDMIATIDDVKAQIDDPNEAVVLLDTRSQEEYDNGTIPSSILLDFNDNNYKDVTYKSVQDINIMYRENNIDPDKTVIMYCKTSIRGAQTYLALHNAGYRNLKLFDGAWVEWSSDESLPVQKPSVNTIESNEQDNS